MSDKHNSSFSYRMNIKKKEIQIESMNDALRNRIWNVLNRFYFSRTSEDIPYGDKGQFYKEIWDGFFKQILDDLNIHNYDPNQQIKNRFAQLEWNEVYGFIEFILATEYAKVRNSHVDELNHILECECSAYRITNKYVVPITNDAELDEINKVLNTGIDEFRSHFESAVQKFSDRDNPDYENTIKESINALEFACRQIIDDDQATLGRALDTIKDKKPRLIEENLAESMRKLYKFSNEASGVRHGSSSKKYKINSNDARFVLVTCSAIANYLISIYPGFKHHVKQR